MSMRVAQLLPAPLLNLDESGFYTTSSHSVPGDWNPDLSGTFPLTTGCDLTAPVCDGEAAGILAERRDTVLACASCGTVGGFGA